MRYNELITEGITFKQPGDTKKTGPITDPNEILIYIEDKIFQMDWYRDRPERIASLRDEPAYKNAMPLLLKLSKKIGVEKLVAARKALGVYSNTFYGRMNNSLRAGKLPKNTDLIDLYLEHAPKSKANVMYRGLSGEFFKTLTVGQILVDPAYVSITGDLEVATYFSKKGKKGGVLEIHGVANRAVKMPRETDEDEYLLPRGCSFKIISIDGAHAIVELM